MLNVIIVTDLQMYYKLFPFAPITGQFQTISQVDYPNFHWRVHTAHTLFDPIV